MEKKLSFMERLAARDEANAEAVKAYVKKFMLTNDMAKRAIEQGWERPLENFVRLTANTMQQIVCCASRGQPIKYGWSNLAVPGDYLLVYKALLEKAVDVIGNRPDYNVLIAMPDLAPNYWLTKAMRTKAS